jgi:hypothetical protein
VGRPVEAHESLSVSVVPHGRLLPSRALARYGLVLQRVVQDGRLNLQDSLLDHNNRALPVSIT